ncbi:MAG: RDD family protein [Thiotrichales bacterium]|jgi:uncharacterized RDD family membrane protein YckC|nr:RDD family protein [Thiotrichales bacterium]MDP6162936.1 RDD family protein [Candidatus Thioglobus sp.]|tara:strand:+ start:9363 stop:9782 length:420 start_codon:yes stop_codon:yes gene_type:complete
MKSNVSFFRRIGSISYDLFLVFSFVFFIAGIVILVNNKEPITNPYFFFLVTLPAIYAYFSISWVKGKQTLGMRAWKFEITQEDGDNITYRQSAIRFLLAVISLAGVGFIFQFLNKNKLPIHDYYSKTYLMSIYKQIDGQ